MKKLLLSAVAIAASMTVSAQGLYMIGAMEGYGWDPEVGMEMEEIEDGVYQCEAVMPSSPTYFAFTTTLGDWVDINAGRVAPEEKDAPFIVGEDNPFVLGVDASWQIDAGTYVFTVYYDEGYVTAEMIEGGNGDDNTPVAPGPETSVPAPEQLYLIGGITGWDPSNGMEMELVEEGVFALTNVEFTGDLYFSFTAELGDWETVNANRVGPAADGDVFSPTEANPFKWGVENAWQFEEAGTYDLYVNFNSMKAACSLSAGVESLKASSNGEDVIYNLQGVRVANPTKGLYIINGKKVLVR